MNISMRTIICTLFMSMLSVIGFAQTEPEFEMEKHSWFFGAYTKTSTKVKGWGLKVNGIKEDKHLIANF